MCYENSNNQSSRAKVPDINLILHKFKLILKNSHACIRHSCTQINLRMLTCQRSKTTLHQSKVPYTAFMQIKAHFEIAILFVCTIVGLNTNVGYTLAPTDVIL